MDDHSRDERLDMLAAGEQRKHSEMRHGDGSRHVLWVVGIAGALVLVQAGAVLYYFTESRTASETQASRLAALTTENASFRKTNAALHETNATLQRKVDELTNEQTRLRDELARLPAGVQQNAKAKPSPPAKRGGRTVSAAPRPKPATPSSPVQDGPIPDEVLPVR